MAVPEKPLRMVPKAEGLERKEPQFLSPEDISRHAASLPDDDEISSDRPDLDSYGQPIVRAFNGARLAERAMDELIGICKGIIADDFVKSEEAQFLFRWMEANRGAAGQWPANILYSRLKEMLVDRALDPSEQAELLDLLREFIGSGVPASAYVENHSSSLPLTRPAPEIQFPDRLFCLTGKFASGTRKRCESLILAKGGKPQGYITTETNYLVIGLVGSTDWIHSTHGRKIEYAIELRESGRPIAIVSEDHWLRFL
jgi:NAD-dependent DNA ligase